MTRGSLLMVDCSSSYSLFSYAEPSFKYITRLRIKEVKYILRSRNKLSMKQVSERVGYPNLYYFSRIFKQITGVMASEYKLQ
ncbi:MAG: two component transcriptional regulator, AraC family [Paenibacillus sp.]|nr:two component transcriptional regulator, AraC family [Paenibacillus sp.]